MEKQIVEGPWVPIEQQYQRGFIHWVISCVLCVSAVRAIRYILSNVSNWVKLWNDRTIDTKLGTSLKSITGVVVYTRQDEVKRAVQRCRGANDATTYSKCVLTGSWGSSHWQGGRGCPAGGQRRETRSQQ